MSKKPLTLSLVIPVYNEQNHLKTCLNSVMSQSYQFDQIIVVDNNSTDQTVTIAKQHPSVQIVTEAKQGVLFAARAGFDASSSDIICRIDADTVLPPDWAMNIKHFFESNPLSAAITGNCYFYDFPFKRLVQKLHHAVYYTLQKLIAGTEILWGSNMAIRNTAWKLVRSYCTSHPGIHEDIDLTFHLQNRNFSIERLATIQVGVSFLRGNLNPLKLIRYMWPWPTDSLASYFWSWPRTYWFNKRYWQAIAITTLMISSGIITAPILLIANLKN